MVERSIALLLCLSLLHCSQLCQSVLGDDSQVSDNIRTDDKPFASSIEHNHFHTVKHESERSINPNDQPASSSSSSPSSQSSSPSSPSSTAEASPSPSTIQTEHGSAADSIPVSDSSILTSEPNSQQQQHQEEEKYKQEPHEYSAEDSAAGGGSEEPAMESESEMNVNRSAEDGSGSVLTDLYELSLKLADSMADVLSNIYLLYSKNFALEDNYYSPETIASAGALLVSIVVYYVCHSRPDSICSKYLRYINVLSVFTLLLSGIGRCFKWMVKTPESLEYEMNCDNSGAYSMQGRRGGMEDRFTLKNSLASELGVEFYAVYDGHGGPNAAAYAEKELFSRITRRIKLLITEPTSAENPTPKVRARTPLKEVKNLLTRMTSDVTRFDLLNVNDLKNIINDEVISFDAKLVDEFTKKQDISGTTALIVVKMVKANTLLVANVGDSRAILCDWKNATIPLSFDHKPDKLKEYRRVMEAGGHIVLRGVFRVNGILAVSRALGDYPLKNNRIVIPDPDILTFDLDDLRPRFMIIASDGFWDTFSNENAVQYVRNELTHYGTNYVAKGSGSLAVQIAKKLAQESYNRESYDNITVIVVLFEESDGAIKSRVGIAKMAK